MFKQLIKKVVTLLLLMSVCVVADESFLHAENQVKENATEFMHQVLANRAVNTALFEQFELKEKIDVLIKGKIEDAPIRSINLRMAWQFDDGAQWRVPLSVNGIRINPENQKLYRSSIRNSDSEPQRFTPVIRLQQLTGIRFDKGDFYFAGGESYRDQRVLVVEYYTPSELLNSNDETVPGTMLDKQVSKAVFYIIPETFQIAALFLSFEQFQFNQVEALNVLPKFIASRIKFFNFRDVELALHMQPLERGWVPEKVEIVGTKRRMDNNLKIEYSREFYDYRSVWSK